MAETSGQGIWASLDKLGGNVVEAAQVLLQAELAKKLNRDSTPAVAYVPNTAGAATDTTSAGKLDPNSLQRYALWGVLGVLGLVGVLAAARYLKRA